MLSLDTAITKSTDLVEECVDNDCIVIYDPAADYTHVLNETSSFLWKNCDDRTVGETIDILIAAINFEDPENSEVTREQVISDCMAAFEAMAVQNIISVSE